MFRRLSMCAVFLFVCDAMQTCLCFASCGHAHLSRLVFLLSCELVSSFFLLSCCVLHGRVCIFLIAASVCVPLPPPYRDAPWVWYTCIPTLLLAAVAPLFTDRGQRLVKRATGNRLFKSQSSEPPLASSLQTRPSGGHIDASDIAISQNPDGTQILLGSGSSGKVCPRLPASAPHPLCSPLLPRPPCCILSLPVLLCVAYQGLQGV